MKCLITIPGNDKGYGHPAKNRIEPIENFLVNNNVFFTHIRQHLVKCDKCDANEFMEVYLSRYRVRRKPFIDGLTSTAFVKHVMMLDRMLQKSKKYHINFQYIKETLARASDPEIFSNSIDKFSNLDLVQVCELHDFNNKISPELMKRTAYWINAVVHKSKRFEAVSGIWWEYKGNGLPLDEAELENQMAVWHTHHD